MHTTVKLIALSLGILIAMAILPLKAEPMPHLTASDSLAVIHIPQPTEAHMMHLAGLVGRGTAYIHRAGEDGCKSMTVRMAAGGFWGLEPRIKGEPVQIILRAPHAIDDLINGTEVIGGTLSSNVHPAALEVTYGLPPETGFVIDPGATGLANILGVRLRDIPCSLFQTAYARAAR